MTDTVERIGDKYRVTCTHGSLIRDVDDALHRVTDRRPECGCYEIEVCCGCGGEDCGGCPCGTAMLVKERDGNRHAPDEPGRE